MKQTETLLRVNEDGTEERWYSDEYIREQIEQAFIAGLAAGTQVKFHAMEPRNIETVVDYKTLFWNVINEEYEKKFAEGRVWKIAQSRRIPEPIRG